MSRFLKVKPLRYVSRSVYLIVAATADKDEFVDIEVSDEDKVLRRGLEKENYILVSEDEKQTDYH